MPIDKQARAAASKVYFDGSYCGKAEQHITDILAAYEAARPEPVSSEPVSLEKCAKAIQERYWKGDIAITISDARRACTEFAKAALEAAGVAYD